MFPSFKDVAKVTVVHHWEQERAFMMKTKPILVTVSWFLLLRVSVQDNQGPLKSSSHYAL